MSGHYYQALDNPVHPNVQNNPANPGVLWGCANPFVSVRKSAFRIAAITGAIWFAFTWVLPSSLALPNIIGDLVGTAAIVSYFAAYIGAERQVQRLEQGAAPIAPPAINRRLAEDLEAGEYHPPRHSRSAAQASVFRKPKNDESLLDPRNNSSHNQNSYY